MSFMTSCILDIIQVESPRRRWHGLPKYRAKNNLILERERERFTVASAHFAPFSQKSATLSDGYQGFKRQFRLALMPIFKNSEDSSTVFRILFR